MHTGFARVTPLGGALLAETVPFLTPKLLLCALSESAGLQGLRGRPFHYPCFGQQSARGGSGSTKQSRDLGERPTGLGRRGKLGLGQRCPRSSDLGSRLLAARIPATVRSRIRSRSNSAMLPRT